MKLLLLLGVWSCTVRAFVTLSRASAHPSTIKLHLFNSVEAAIAEAQRICAASPSSDECRVAWDVVEELEAAHSHRQNPMQGGQALAIDPVALVGSFDILTQKIDGKMDQLKATAYQLQALGADPSAMSELARLSDEMKQALVNARTTLP